MEFLSQGRRSGVLLNKIEALLIFDPLITLWCHFKASYFKMLNDTRVASVCLYVRTCQRVRNSKNIAIIRDFQLHVRVNSTKLSNGCKKNSPKYFFVKIGCVVEERLLYMLVPKSSRGQLIPGWALLFRHILRLYSFHSLKTLRPEPGYRVSSSRKCPLAACYF